MVDLFQGRSIMPKRRYRKQTEYGLIEGLIHLLVDRPTERQAETLQLAIGTRANRPDELRPRELEELAAEVFNKLGYKNVVHSGAHSSTDGGVDVWMLNAQGLPEIIQCKQLKSRVDRTELISFARTMRKQHAVKGHYWAPGGFTQPAIDYASKNNIQIYEELEIRKLVEKVYQDDFERGKNNQQTPAVYTKPKRYYGLTLPQIFVLLSLFLIFCILASCLIYFIISSSSIPLFSSAEEVSTELNPLVISTQTKPAELSVFAPTLTVNSEPAIVLTSTPTQDGETDWVWVDLPIHETKVYLPENWNVILINEKTIPWDSGTKHCGDYLLYGPNQEVITLTMSCEFGEGMGGPCDDNIQIIEEIDDNHYLYRYPIPQANKYYYESAYYGEWTWASPSGFGYWCMSSSIRTYTFEIQGKTLDEITDFSIVDEIMLSLFQDQ